MLQRLQQAAPYGCPLIAVEWSLDFPGPGIWSPGRDCRIAAAVEADSLCCALEWVGMRPYLLVPL